MKKVLTTIALILYMMTIPLTFSGHPGPAYVISSPSVGGYIRNYANAVDVFDHYRIPLEIRESCASSCTLFLAVDNVCIDGNASFTFHSSKDKKADEFLMSKYPPKVGQWIKDRGGLTDTPLEMGFDEAKAMVKVCE